MATPPGRLTFPSRCCFLLAGPPYFYSLRDAVNVPFPRIPIFQRIISCYCWAPASPSRLPCNRRVQCCPLGRVCPIFSFACLLGSLSARRPFVSINSPGRKALFRILCRPRYKSYLQAEPLGALCFSFPIIATTELCLRKVGRLEQGWFRNPRFGVA